MPFKRNHRPWNKGLRGLEAGWTPERRQWASDRQRERIQEDPAKYHIMHRSGPQPHTWITGPDPAIKEHRRRWSRARAQAKFWSQEWTILWEDYLDLLKTAPGEWSRDADDLNLTRVDTTQGWHIWNVRLMRRIDAMKRPTRGKKRIRPQGQGAKARGENWRRGGHTKTVVKKRTAPVSSDKPIDTDEYNQMKYRNHPSMKKGKGGYRGKPNHPNRNHKFS